MHSTNVSLNIHHAVPRMSALTFIIVTSPVRGEKKTRTTCTVLVKLSMKSKVSENLWDERIVNILKNFTCVVQTDGITSGIVTRRGHGKSPPHRMSNKGNHQLHLSLYLESRYKYSLSAIE